jgi:hypothetical protein
VIDTLRELARGEAGSCVKWEAAFTNIHGIRSNSQAVISPLVFSCDDDSLKLDWANIVADRFCYNVLLSVRNDGPLDSTCHACYIDCCRGIAFRSGMGSEGVALLIEVCKNRVNLRDAGPAFAKREERNLSIRPDNVP